MDHNIVVLLNFVFVFGFVFPFSVSWTFFQFNFNNRYRGRYKRSILTHLKSINMEFVVSVTGTLLWKFNWNHKCINSNQQNGKKWLREWNFNQENQLRNENRTFVIRKCFSVSLRNSSMKFFYNILIRIIIEDYVKNCLDDVEFSANSVLQFLLNIVKLM